MSVQSHVSSIQGVALKHLFLSPHNVRKDESEDGIAELAASIEVEGVLQNLAGYEERSTPKSRKNTRIGVVAGGRRWRALQLLLKERKITGDYLVPCLITTQDAAVAISLAENSERKPLLGHLLVLSSVFSPSRGDVRNFLCSIPL
jgi:ParB family chromosome partitioning protein